jgi:hypothetical protein
MRFSSIRWMLSTHFRLFNVIIFYKFGSSNCLNQWFSNGAPQEVARCAPNIIKEYFNKKFWEELMAYFPWHDTGHIENDASNNSSTVAWVFVTAVTFLPSRWLATIGRFLPGRCLATIRGFLRSRCLATIGGFLPGRCLTTIGGYTDTHRQQRDLISLLYFFKIGT